VAFADPAADGLKVTVNGTLWPALMVAGSDSPLTLNCELLEFAAVTVTLEPVAFRLADAVPLPPATTLPKESVLGLTASCPSPEEPEDPVEPLELADPEPPLLTPWQPTRKTRAASASVAPADLLKRLGEKNLTFLVGIIAWTLRLCIHRQSARTC
jgi:hypothetical protein